MIVTVAHPDPWSNRGQEVTQTVFIILAKQAAHLGLNTILILTGWLYRTANFAATAALRSEHRRKRREHEPMDPDPSPDPQWAEIAPDVEESVSSLGDKDRCAVECRIDRCLPVHNAKRVQ